MKTRENRHTEKTQQFLLCRYIRNLITWRHQKKLIRGCYLMTLVPWTWYNNMRETTANIILMIKLRGTRRGLQSYHVSQQGRRERCVSARVYVYVCVLDTVSDQLCVWLCSSCLYTALVYVMVEDVIINITIYSWWPTGRSLAYVLSEPLCLHRL